MKHYWVHLVSAAIGILCTAFFYQSMTVWEMILFLSMTILPIVDDLAYAALHYAQNADARETINLVFVDDIFKALISLHDSRKTFTERYIHNIFVYTGLWLVWFTAYVYDQPIVYYAISGILTHLVLDITNDLYEYQSLSLWTWPITLAYDGLKRWR